MAERKLSEPTPIFKVVLERARLFLVDDLIFDPVHDYLISEGVITASEMRSAKEQRTTPEKIYYLLDLLRRGDEETYDTFKRALDYSRQTHIRKKLEKLEKLGQKAPTEGNPPYSQDEVFGNTMVPPDSYDQDGPERTVSVQQQRESSANDIHGED